MVETFRNPLQPVENTGFSTTVLHGRNGQPEPYRSVFPVVHTPYDFYERI